MAQIKTFLGANTPRGFISLFDEIHNPYKDINFYLIKGGPGTGKSSFMKNVALAAEKKGFFTERVYCSSDPDSLDAVIIKDISLIMADATSPHIIEPRFPGISETVINPGDFWDRKKLLSHKEEIRALYVENSLYHRRSSHFLASLGEISKDSERILFEAVNKDKIESYCVRFASREFPSKKSTSPGKKERRFISGITPKGVVFFDSTIKALSNRVIGINDEHSAVSPLIIERLGDLASKNGYDVILFKCPVKPDSFEHLIIPEISLCVTTVKKEHPSKIKADRLIHPRRFLFDEALREQKNRLSFNRKMENALLKESVSYLKKAKETHDRLEKFYVEAMDFDALNSFEEKFIKNNILI